MIKKGVLWTFVIMLCAYLGTLSAEENCFNYYLRVRWNLGWHSEDEGNFLKDSNMEHRNFGGAVAVGKLLDPCRLELSWSMIRTDHLFFNQHYKNDLKIHIDAWNLIANAYYDHKINDRLYLYTGLGIGLSFIEHYSESEDSRITKTVPCVQFTGGLAHNLRDYLQITAGYRFFVLTHFKDYYSHNLDIGLLIKL